ncbi:MAG: FliM/FliN family flagellar motor switch protein [Planctomycetes bacterium]|nr:FliM/FliN family flagellar motor switch protein [Planctomycetota bacterium]
MGEILSHAEVEAILSAVAPSRPEPRTPAASTSPDTESVAWERHDFHRPEPLTGTALKIVHALHEGICQCWQGRLETLLPSRTIVRPVGACHSTASEFLAAVSEPSVICQIRHEGSGLESLLVWNADLVQSLIAGMLGGDAVQASTTAARAMTSIELRLLGRLNEAVLQELTVLLNDPLAVTAILPNLAAVPGRIANFPSIWFSVEVNGCGATGLIHLAIPGRSLNAQGTEPPVEELSASDIPTGIRQVSVQVSATLANLKISTADLAALQVGDMVMTDLSPDSPVSLQLDGHTLSQATVGTHLGRKALRLM